MFLNLLNLNYNLFLFGDNSKFNVNHLNYNFYNHLFFKKNFFFFFFKVSWVRLEKNKEYFLFLLNEFDVKLLFFFNLKLNPHLTSFFFNQMFLLSGLVASNKRNVFFDYPILTKNPTFLHVYVMYLFFIKMCSYKNHAHHNTLNFNNYYFFNFLGLN